MKTSDLEKIIYFQDYVVVDPLGSPLKRKQLLNEEEYRQARDKYGDGGFTAQTGAEAVKSLLLALDLPTLSVELREGITKTNSKQKLKDLAKRLKIVEALRGSGNSPDWMVMETIPVIPPDLRPLVLLESGN